MVFRKHNFFLIGPLCVAWIACKTPKDNPFGNSTRDIAKNDTNSGTKQSPAQETVKGGLPSGGSKWEVCERVLTGDEEDGQSQSVYRRHEIVFADASRGALYTRSYARDKKCRKKISFDEAVEFVDPNVNLSPIKPTKKVASIVVKPSSPQSELYDLDVIMEIGEDIDKIYLTAKISEDFLVISVPCGEEMKEKKECDEVDSDRPSNRSRKFPSSGPMKAQKFLRVRE